VPIALLVAVVLALATVAVLVGVVQPMLTRRLHDDARTLRWVPVVPGADHAALGPVVGELGLLGYVVQGHARLGLGARPVPVTLLAHPDGSLADVAALPRAVGVSITSLLADGATVLETHDHQSLLDGPHRLVEVLPGAPPTTLVALHRATRAWLEQQGLGPVLDPGGPVRLYERSIHLVGLQEPPPGRVVRALVAGRHVPNRGPLAEQPGTAARLAELAARTARTAPGPV
jgi:hypothetical protein